MPLQGADEGDQEFESLSLQRRVFLSPQAALVRGEPRLSARVCAAGLAASASRSTGLLSIGTDSGLRREGMADKTTNPAATGARPNTPGPYPMHWLGGEPNHCNRFRDFIVQTFKSRGDLFPARLRGRVDLRPYPGTLAGPLFGLHGISTANTQPRGCPKSLASA